MDIKTKVNLAEYTTFRIGGPADYFLIAKNKKEIIEGIKFAKIQKIPFFILGIGANILIGDGGFRGLVIKNEAKEFEFDGDLLTAQSGAVIADLINFTLKKGLSGLEHFAGIPSSVGGALWQNLHFLNSQRTKTVYIGDIVENAEILQMSYEKNNFIKEISRVKVNNSYFNFDYDYSILHKTHDVVLQATLKLKKADPKKIKEIIDKNFKWRREKHPFEAEKNSAGSVFKKIEGYGAGRLIDKVGLKGYQIGGAQISPKHTNFIINVDNATAKDVRALIDKVKNKVKKELGLSLETEISFVGDF